MNRKVRAAFEILRAQENICRCDCGRSLFTYNHIDNVERTRRSIIDIISCLQTQAAENGTDLPDDLNIAVASVAFDVQDHAWSGNDNCLRYIKLGLSRALIQSVSIGYYNDVIAGLIGENGKFNPCGVITYHGTAGDVAESIVGYLKYGSTIRRPFLDELIRTSIIGHLHTLKLYGEQDGGNHSQPTGHGDYVEIPSRTLRYYSFTEHVIPTPAIPRTCGRVSSNNITRFSCIFIFGRHIIIASPGPAALLRTCDVVTTILKFMRPFVVMSDGIRVIDNLTDAIDFISSLSHTPSLAHDETFRAATSVLGFAMTRERLYKGGRRP